METTNLINNCESFCGNRNEGDYNENEIKYLNKKCVDDICGIGCDVKANTNERSDIIVDTNEIKSKFNEVEDRLSSQENRLVKLECNMTLQSEILKDLADDQKSMNNNINTMNMNLLNHSNSILTSLNNLIITREKNENTLEITKEIGKNKICKQTIVTIGSIICALIASGFAYYQYSHPIVSKVINPTTSGVIEKVIK